MGKFEKNNRPKAQEPSEPKRKPKQKKNPLPIILGLVASITVVLAGVVGYLLLQDDNRIEENVYVAGVDLSNMTKEEAFAALKDVSFDYNTNIHLYGLGEEFPVYLTSYDPASEVDVDIYGKPIVKEDEEATEAPTETAPSEGGTEVAEIETETTGIETEAAPDPKAPLQEDGTPYTLDQTILMTAADVALTVDVQQAVEEAYQYGRTTEAEPDESGRIHVDITKYMTFDETYIRDTLNGLAEVVVRVGTETRVEKGTTKLQDEDGNESTVDCLNITLGNLKRRLDTEAVFDAIVDLYRTGSTVEDENGEKIYELYYVYDETIPEPVDLDKLYKDYECVEPVNAVCDEETYDVTEGSNGFGFRMSEAVELLNNANPGETVTLPLRELQPKYTKETLSAQLFCDVLAEYDSPHSYNPTRTKNLELASKAINGTILKPGEEFSFNKIVGERTADKGYGPAGVYVGGRTENQLGGGVCQVASTIYYCTLKADLKVTERYEHQYLPAYVPWGMDATIYWGYLDYRFVNNTEYPIRIDAKVSDGYVRVKLVGTNTKDYTVELDYKTTKYEEAGEKKIYIHPDMADYNEYKNYYEGETIQTPYDGATVETYRYKYDMDGNLISQELVNISVYDKRDREIATFEKEDDEDEKPTEPPATEPPATEPPATEPPATEPPATEPPATEPPVTEPPVTEPPVTPDPELPPDDFSD